MVPRVACAEERGVVSLGVEFEKSEGNETIGRNVLVEVGVSALQDLDEGHACANGGSHVSAGSGGNECGAYAVACDIGDREDGA